MVDKELKDAVLDMKSGRVGVLRPHLVERIQVEQDFVAMCVSKGCWQLSREAHEEIVGRLFEKVPMARLASTRARTHVICRLQIVALIVRLIGDFVFGGIEAIDRAVVGEVIVVLLLYERRNFKVARRFALEVTQTERRILDHVLL